MNEHRGYFIVEEEALRKLRATYDRPSAYRLALLAYVTMCRIANLEGADTFERTISSIAQDAGLSYNAAAEALGLIESVGLITIEGRRVPGTKERAPSRYTVVRMFPTECGTSPTEEVRLPKTRNLQLLPRVPNHLPSTHQEPTKGEASPPRPRFMAPSAEQAEEEALAIGLPSGEGRAFVDHHQAKGWLIGKSPMRDWRAAMRTWKRNFDRYQTNGSGRRTIKTGPDYLETARKYDNRI